MTAGLALGTAGRAGAEPDAAAHLQRANELVSQNQLAAACDELAAAYKSSKDPLLWLRIGRLRLRLHQPTAAREAGLSDSVQGYTHSTLKMVLGLKAMEFPVFDNMSLIQNPNQVLEWLNTPYPDPEILRDLRDALRYPEMEFKTKRETQRISPLADRLF